MINPKKGVPSHKTPIPRGSGKGQMYTTLPLFSQRSYFYDLKL
uniref:Uncharacterized protein n=1 Tax=Rhizophora mucronata TaxID=61149 RepID=A0A2P2QP91_RHIMU